MMTTKNGGPARTVTSLKVQKRIADGIVRDAWSKHALTLAIIKAIRSAEARGYEGALAKARGETE